MKLELATILKIVQAATGEGPAFGALLGQVKSLFKEKDQQTLQDAYDKAKVASNAAQDDFVKAGRGK